MANNIVNILVDIAVKGREALKGATADVKEMEGAAKKGAGGFDVLSKRILAGTAVIAGASIAAKQLYSVFREGATLETTSQRFDKLSASIGSTADVMLGQLKTATQGMISDMDLMASASQIISLKLADNSQQVVRLATVAGTLGWDMQQVILTFANLSTMRLDALGLSVDEVKDKAAELEKTGMSASEAFKEAVILAGEARLDIGQVSETEKAFKQLEAAIANSKSELSLFAIELATSIGLIDGMTAAVDRMSFNRMVSEAREAGEITEVQVGILKALAITAGTTAAAMELSQMQTRNALGDTGKALGINVEAYRMWSDATTYAMRAVQGEAIITLDAIMRAVAQADAVLMQTVDNWQRGRSNSRLESDMLSGRNGLPWMNPERIQTGALTRATMQYDEATASVRGYSAALTEAQQMEQALMTVHARMADAFMTEINYVAPVDDPKTKKNEGGEDMSLVLESGLVNVTAMNKALYDQFQVAGATAGQLAILGVATGQFTQEQAQAALKAAILHEKIKMLAAQAVKTGDIAGVLSSVTAFQQQLDAGQIAGAADSFDTLAGAADEFAGEYAAELSVEDRAAMQAINDVQSALNSLVSGSYVATLSVNTVGVTGTGGAGGGTNITPAGRPEITTNSIGPGGKRDLISGASGGSSYNISISNYIDGKAQSRSHVDDVTTDKLLAALQGFGMKK
jgi:hypothetical protein